MDVGYHALHRIFVVHSIYCVLGRNAVGYSYADSCVAESPDKDPFRGSIGTKVPVARRSRSFAFTNNCLR